MGERRYLDNDSFVKSNHRIVEALMSRCENFDIASQIKQTAAFHLCFQEQSLVDFGSCEPL